MTTQQREETKPKEEVVHKYSNKGKGQPREAIIMDGKEYFLRYSEEKGFLYIEPYIDENTRRLRPPHLEECPYEPYEFDSKLLNQYYLPLAKKETIDTLYQKIKDKVELFNDVDKYVLNLMSMNVIGSCFQDRLSTVHYLLIVGGNGTGKSAFGDTFECLGYRVVNITNATEAFWYRVLGSVEFGQVTIVAEEIDKLDENGQIMNMLKTGYQPNAKVPRMNSDNDKMDFYYPFCFKILIAERSPKEDRARGVLDRTFKINSYKGYPEFKIKEIRNPQGNKARQKTRDELSELRKILLIYKLIHAKDPLIEVDIGLDGRDEELCKPILQLFYSLGASKETQEELEGTLQHFLSTKNKRKQNSREALIYPIVKDTISEYGSKMDVGILWNAIIESFAGQMDDKNENMYHTADYGDLYRSTIIGMITDKFGGELDHKRKGNLIEFNKDILERMGKQYDDTKGIHTKVIDGNCDSCDSRDSLTRTRLIDDKDGFDIASLENPNYKDDEGVHQYESPESPESPNNQDYPPKCYRCDFKPNNKQEYEHHCINEHPRLAGHPNKASLEADNLEAQGCFWER